MTTIQIRTKLASAHSVQGVNAQVKRIGTGSLKGGWTYKKFRPGYMFRGSTWLYAGMTAEVIRYLS